MKKLLLLAIVVLGISAVSFGQSPTLTVTASANLVTPLKIEKGQDLDFATVAGSSNASSILMNLNGSLTPGDGAYKISGTSKAAKFIISGEAGQVITFTRPTDAITLVPVEAGANTDVTIDTWTDSEGNDGLATIGEGNTLNLFVAGTLNLPANVKKSLYKNETELTVTVNYQ